ncbi:iron(III) transport system permease protein [Tumebacillus sp. BK434]|uniref:ABC transporter permease n=1 Tax=Tumebacillus sp. BK434 TaxID=2512169 RepID=UPI00104914C7|nr:iron ABC transporter permease [Tumebacillus sp. BK434]TCP57916.1 iron(III) transport system permease protein [Tumebacillus sp. BK434]
MAAWRRNFRKYANGWWLISLAGVAVILLPIFSILLTMFSAPSENWAHIRDYLLADYVLETLTVVGLTALFTTLIGVGLAWLVAAYDFPGKRFLRWALVLPLAVPPYIAAYTYSTMLSYTGLVQVTLREWGVVVKPGLIDLLSMRGAVFIFTMFLFPYVYLITRSFLERQSGTYLENARLLGRGPWAIFFRVVLPIARPAVIGGVSLVVFEVISDYGVSSYFGVSTFSTAIFQTWFGLYDLNSAVRLAAWLMAGLIGFFLIERMLRRQQRYSTSTGKLNPLVPKRLRGAGAALATLCAGGVFAVSFAIPVLQLIQWAVRSWQDVWSPEFVQMALNTVQVAMLASVAVIVLSVIVANAARMQKNGMTYALSKLVTAGYSIPGAILAIGTLSLFIWLDEVLAPCYAALGMEQAPIVLSLSLVMLVFAYVVRFMATGYQAVETGFEKSGPKYTEASRLLGRGLTATFFKVDLPLVKGAVLSGAVLTFVEIIKELPLVLLLRPFNFETLATKTYQYASDERIFEAAVPAICIIAVSSLSVAVFHQIGKRVEK